MLPIAVVRASLLALMAGAAPLALAQAPAATGSGLAGSGQGAGQVTGLPGDATSDYATREAAWRAAGHFPPFQGVGQTRTELEGLAIDLQLFDLCRDPRVTDAELSPLLQVAARLRGGEANCTEVMRRLGY